MAGPVTLKDVDSIILTDTDGTNELTLTLEDGDLSYTLPDLHQHVADRGAPGTIIDAPFEPIPFSMTVQVKEFTGSAGVQDVITCTASGWTFTEVTTGSGDYNGKSSDLSDVDSNVGVFQMRAQITNPFDSVQTTLYFLDCRASIQFQEGMPNKFTITGVSYTTVSSFMSNIATA